MVGPYSSNSLNGPTVPYPHLLNFFRSDATERRPRVAPHFEYLTVPSPFVGTDVWANPQLAASSTGNAYHPPFNRISNYREPGRINLNTIYDPDVFNALMAGGTSTTDPITLQQRWSDFTRSRSGGTGQTSWTCPLLPRRRSSPTPSVPSLGRR